MVLTDVLSALVCMKSEELISSVMGLDGEWSLSIHRRETYPALIDLSGPPLPDCDT